jgi:hypothetical protein
VTLLFIGLYFRPGFDFTPHLNTVVSCAFFYLLSFQLPFNYMGMRQLNLTEVYRALSSSYDVNEKTFGRAGSRAASTACS